jgi:hypothetical protein
MYEFQETVTLKIPNVEKQLASFSEGESNNHGLIVELAAIHEGITANFNRYSVAELEKSLESWVSPYPKPIIMNHDPESEPVGRVMQAKMDKEADGTPFVRLQAAITDPEAMKKVADARYLTGSVGGKAKEATCSICNANWANASMFNLPCKHVRGKSYKGQIAHIEMKDIGFREYSFVNMPADQHSSVRSVGAGAQPSEEKPEEDDGWVKARIFDLNMDKPEIVEFCESEDHDILEGMKQKDAGPLYHNLRGAFLSALAISESEREESQMDDEILEEGEEDILSVTEELSNDLATDPVEEEVVEEEEEVTEEEPVAETDDDTKDEVVSEEGERPEGQEKPAKDVDPETSKGAPKSRESDEEETVVEEDNNEVAELNERIKTLESLVAEFETSKQSLLEVNAKLKLALKKSLAERVVDSKISLGLEEKSERAALVEEHLSRTARSLADSLRDLVSMAPAKREVPNYEGVPTVTNESVAITSADEEKLVFTVSPEVVKESDPDPERFFTDVLMGRRKLR